MNILCLYQFFTTGRTPGSMRPFRLCKRMAEKGHAVTVIATDFNFASGESEGPLYEEIQTRGKPLIIYRIPSNRSFRKSLFHRMKTYVGFAGGALLKGIAESRQADIVLTSIQPIFIGPVGWLVAAVRRIPFFLEVRDIWPDALEAKGAIKNRAILHILYAIANFIYTRACYIVSLTPGIAEELVKKGIEGAKIDVLPNGLDPELFSGRDNRRDAVRSELGWRDHFVAVYIGVHTEVTAIDTIVKAAERCGSDARMRFEIFGSGTTTPLIERLIAEKGLPNVHLNGTVAKERVPDLLAAADVCLMCLFESPLIHIYFQNKFFDYMGAAKPIVAALRGHQRSIIEKEGLGMCVDPFDDAGLADAIGQLADHPERGRQMGKKAYAFARQFFCLDDILERYVELVAGFAGGLGPKTSRFSYRPGIFVTGMAGEHLAN
jgi:glycosyltransferase involved in cell wall biosynthesis